MSNDLIHQKEDKSVISKDNTLVNQNVFQIATLEDANRITEYIANSPLFNKQFIEEDENGNKVVNKNSILVSLMLGDELGFKPIESITLGKYLNREAIIKVRIGENLGLSPMNAIKNIYVWSQNGRDEVYTSIHVVNKVLSDCRVKREIIEDGSPIRIYVDATNSLIEITDYNENQSKYLDITDLMSNKAKLAEVVSKEENQSKQLIISKIIRRAKVKLTRRDETICIPYSEQQAIDAGLLGGKDRWGNEIKGKDNWNNHTSTMLIKMSIMLGARILVSDKLNGIYEKDELPIVTHKNINDNYEEVEEVLNQ